jgi:hypothetical protein
MMLQMLWEQANMPSSISNIAGNVLVLEESLKLVQIDRIRRTQPQQTHF